MLIMRRQLLITAILIAFGLATPASAACGDRGGPGYRSSKGHCVGWAELGKVCGNPPTSRCEAEGVKEASDEAAELGSKVEKLRQENRKNP